jgi:hypothetical protein
MSEERQKDVRVWKSYVYNGGKCFFISTIQRDYETCEGLIRGYETLAWEFDWETNTRGSLVWQGGGVVDHQAACRCVIAEGCLPDRDDESHERFFK